MTADLDIPCLKAATEKALIFTLTADAEQAADAIEEIVAMGPRAVHAALSGWSGLTLQGFAEDQGTTPFNDGFWVTETEDARTGQMVSIDEVGNPAIRDAVRLVTCLGNRDHATIAAIVKTSWNAGPETLAALMVESVRLAASMASLLRERREGAA